ncbi:MAG: hypothetical protein NZ990_09270, partial [Myxococcota bacterium]|nr:hypothetical protein [Myxococcota bacterium]
MRGEAHVGVFGVHSWLDAQQRQPAFEQQEEEEPYDDAKGEFSRRLHGVEWGSGNGAGEERTEKPRDT